MGVPAARASRLASSGPTPGWGTGWGRSRAWNPSVRGRPGQLTSEREPSNLQFSAVRKMPRAPLRPRAPGPRLPLPINTSAGRGAACAPHATRTPQPRMRTPGVGVPYGAHSEDQTGPLSSITKAVGATLSQDSVRSNRRFERLLFASEAGGSERGAAPSAAGQAGGRGALDAGSCTRSPCSGQDPGCWQRLRDMCVLCV